MRDVATQLLRGVVVLLALHCAGLAPEAHGQDAPAGGVLFENVRVFNGKDGVLSQPANVLVVGNTIQAISASPISLRQT